MNSPPIRRSRRAAPARMVPVRDLTPGQVISVPTPHRAMVRVNALSDAIAGIRFILVDDATTGEPVIAPLRLGIDTLVALHAEAGSA